MDMSRIYWAKKRLLSKPLPEIRGPTMRIGPASKEEVIAQKSRIKALEAQQRNELQTLENNHEKNKDKIISSNEEDLVKIKSTGDQEKLAALERKTKILEDLDSQIEKIKTIHINEQDHLEKNHAQKLSEKKELHDMQLIARNEKMQDEVETQVADSSFQINKIRKAYQREREALENSHNTQVTSERHLSKEEIRSQKKIFGDQKMALQQKYETELRSLQKKNRDVIANEEVKGQSKLRKNRFNYDTQIEKTIKDGQEQMATQNTRFEENFSKEKNKHENLLQNLTKKKSDLIQNYKNSIYKEVEVLEDRSKDPFYSVPNIDPAIREDSISYKLSFQVPKDQADYYSLTGSGRELKLSMTRRFNDKITNDNGEKQIIAKTESVSKTIKLDEIIDPKSIKKTYENDTLSFIVGKS